MYSNACEGKPLVKRERDSEEGREEGGRGRGREGEREREDLKKQNDNHLTGLTHHSHGC